MSLLGTLLGGGKAPHLRDARASDSADLARIHAASFHRGWGADEFERLLAERAAHAHVICDGPDGAILGFVLSHVVVPEGEILTIAITPRARGKGLSGKLLSHHLGRLAARGVTTSHLEVEAGNTAALALYRRLGYGETGRRKAYYQTADGACDAVVMRRDF